MSQNIQPSIVNFNNSYIQQLSVPCGTNLANNIDRSITPYIATLGYDLGVPSNLWVGDGNNWNKLINNTGSIGPIGNTGPTGIAGHASTTGATGNIGYTGNTGLGATGLMGQTGNSGQIGSTGQIGNTGLIGPTGNSGSTGQVGNTGNTGNNGVLNLSAVGSSPNANSATLSSGTLTLQPASGSFPGVLSTTTQQIAGAKTLTSALSMNSNQINNVADPTNAQDAATKNFIDNYSITINGAVVGSDILSSFITTQLNDIITFQTGVQQFQYTNTHQGSQINIINSFTPVLSNSENAILLLNNSDNGYSLNLETTPSNAAGQLQLYIITSGSNGAQILNAQSSSVGFNVPITLPTSGGTASNLSYYEEATSVSLTFSGPWASSQVASLTFTRIGNIVMFYIPTIVAAVTVSSQIITSTAFPSRFWPTSTNFLSSNLVFNSSQSVSGYMGVSASGVLTITPLTNSFVTSANGGISSGSYSYVLS
jgi:hypothetical protein